MITATIFISALVLAAAVVLFLFITSEEYQMDKARAQRRSKAPKAGLPASKGR